MSLHCPLWETIQLPIVHHLTEPAPVMLKKCTTPGWEIQHQCTPYARHFVAAIPECHHSFPFVSILQSWDAYFRSNTYCAPPSLAPTQRNHVPISQLAPFLGGGGAVSTVEPDEKTIDDHLAVQAIIRSYQVRLFRRIRWHRTYSFYTVIYCHFENRTKHINTRIPPEIVTAGIRLSFPFFSYFSYRRSFYPV